MKILRNEDVMEGRKGEKENGGEPRGSKRNPSHKYKLAVTIFLI